MAINIKDKKMFLSILWIFVTLNYLCCDVMSLMDSSFLKKYLAGNMDGIPLTKSFFLLSAMLIEIPIMMTVLSRLLHFESNRMANILSASILTLVQFATLFVGTPTYYYIFFSVIEIATTGFIVWYAINWKRMKSKVLADDEDL